MLYLAKPTKTILKLCDMKKEILILLIIGTPYILLAQVSGNSLYGQDNRYKFRNEAINTMQSTMQWDNTNIQDPNAVIFNLRGLANIKADAYTAIFNITQVGETATKANELVNQRYEAFLTEIASYVKKEDVYLDMVSQVPIYEVEVTQKLFSKTYNEVPKGFELQKNIHVLYKKGADLDRILEAAAKHEIYDLIKVDYYIEDGDKVFSQLRDSLLLLVNERVKSYNKLLGEKLDTAYTSIQENKAMTFPIDRYSKYTPASSSSVEALGRKSGVTAVRKPTIMFYDKLSYHNFDIIVNPIVLEPVVQYTYQIKVQYHRKRPVQIKTQNHYKIINSNGDVKTLEVK